jgi:predicted CoA-binding protein/predicted RNA methylase
VQLTFHFSFFTFSLAVVERIPEPELMDDPAQARAYAEADFAEPHEAFVRCFTERFPRHRPQRVADLGCGPADVTIRFARAWPQCTILGVDGAQAMLDLGREAVARAGLAGRIRLVQAHLPANLPRGPFDTVISNSLLHHLADPQALWSSVRTCAAPDAAVFVMDLLRPGSRAAAGRLVDRHAHGAPEVLRRDFLRSLLAAYRPEEIEAQLALAGLGRFRVEVVSDRHLVVFGLVSQALVMEGFVNPAEQEIAALLRGARTIAVVGLSPDPGRASHRVAAAMQGFGYRIVPVRPGGETILGKRAVARLEDIREHVDLVDVFRAPEHVDAVVDSCIALGMPALWLQDGVVNTAAAQRARGAGITVVMDRCVYRDYLSFFGPAPRATLS